MQIDKRMKSCFVLGPHRSTEVTQCAWRLHVCEVYTQLSKLSFQSKSGRFYKTVLIVFLGDEIIVNLQHFPSFLLLLVLQYCSQQNFIHTASQHLKFYQSLLPFYHECSQFPPFPTTSLSFFLYIYFLNFVQEKISYYQSN